MTGATERKFEGAIEAHLLGVGGYVKGSSQTFNRALGLDPDGVLAFVAASQPNEWIQLATRHGGEEATRIELPQAARCRDR